MNGNLHIVDHPLVQHKLTLMRSKDTSISAFRTLLHEVSMLLAYEVTRDLPLGRKTIETPLAKMEAPVVDGRKLVFVSILRAGEGMLNGMLAIVPSARVGHVGLYRDHQTLQAVEYYFRVPGDLPERDLILLDPMLATGNSACAAIERLKKEGPRSIKYVCLLAAPQGIKKLQQRHPEMHIFTAAVDPELNQKGYIVPGLGDAGDRQFGTK